DVGGAYAERGGSSLENALIKGWTKERVLTEVARRNSTFFYRTETFINVIYSNFCGSITLFAGNNGQRINHLSLKLRIFGNFV
ncbi:MAG: hypothetical protein FWF72_02930, partial [Paludibacter sp.]|nr:hypothetical protein [Paludibacter sp.]